MLLPQPAKSNTASTLAPLLEEARVLGFLGPGPVAAHIAHSFAFVAAAEEPPAVAADLGTGGGVPALVLVHLWPESRWSLVESNLRRAHWLEQAVIALGAKARCQVLAVRAEEVGRSGLRGTCDLVTARGFSPPGPTAECAAPLLHPGGSLLVAGPPDDGPGRWPTAGTSELGLKYHSTHHYLDDGVPATVTRLVQVAAAPERYPRRTGVPVKRPLF
ncbi:MAG TPA: RsmG family class I SAM-dependent methyltransferase [Acidimicrobiales bacterium]|nr:RsmG family class I SAM-dependent methyltransferase [Acidimicrobiales bacterium]